MKRKDLLTKQFNERSYLPAALKRMKNPLNKSKVFSLTLLTLLVTGSAFASVTDDKKPKKIKKEIVIFHDGGRIAIDDIMSDLSDEFPFDLKYGGRIEVSEDDKMITGMSPNGFFEVNKAAFGNNRRLVITADQDGKLNYEYYVGKSKTSFEPEGKKWLGEILPSIVVRTEVGAESRVSRLYRTKGIQGVVDEIEKFPSSQKKYSTSWSFFSFETTTIHSGSSNLKNTYFKTLVFDNKIKDQDIKPLCHAIKDVRSNSTKGSLLRHLIENYKLNDNQLAALMEAAATHDYNTERGSILRLVNNKFSENYNCRRIYFDIIDDMSINSEKGNVIKDLLKKQKLSTATWIRMLESVDDFTHEREKGAVLLKMLDYLPKDEEVMSNYRRVMDNMSSSYYVLKGEITNALLDATIAGTPSKPDKQILITYLKTGYDISSNSQRGSILRKANKMFIDKPEVLDAYFYVMDDLDSEMEKYNVMLDLLDHNKLSDQAMQMLLRSMNDLVPDYQHGAGAVLREIIKQFPLSSENYDTFFRLIDKMDQNSTIEELMRYIIDQPHLNNEIIIKIIENLDNIDVDVEKSVILVRLAPRIDKKDSSLMYIFKSMIKNLDSEYEKYRVLKTIEQ
ncbi:hypothetical protein DMA11_19805 [Marinilabiliaceae bacterium JC017]|nr:hypothetical protein DMA11_19805 [Marinilabiliaceae bacterium JC017]